MIKWVNHLFSYKRIIMKKISSILLLSIFVLFWYTHAEEFSQEMQEAYEFSYENNITTIDDIKKANINWWLTRIAMAKMLSNYAINVLGRVPDTSKIPNFKDVSAKLNADYDNGVTLAYQLWIMWIWIDKFRPFDLVTRAEFGTAFSRVLFWNIYNQDWKEYYKRHLQALKSAWIMNQIDKPHQWEVRWFVMIMLFRSDKSYRHWNWNSNWNWNNQNNNPVVKPNQNNNKTWDNKSTTWNNQNQTTVWNTSNKTSSWWWGGWGWWWGGWGWWWGGWGWWSNGWSGWDNNKIDWDLTINMVPSLDDNPESISIWYDSIAWKIIITPTKATEDWLEVRNITLMLDDLYTATSQDIESIWLWDNKKYDGLDWIKTDIQSIWGDWTVTLTFNENVNFWKQDNHFYIWVKTKSTAIEWATLDILVKWIDSNIKNVINNASEKRSWIQGRGFYTVLQNLWCENQWLIELGCEIDYELYCPSRYIQKCNYVRSGQAVSEFSNTLEDITLYSNSYYWYDNDNLDENIFYGNQKNILIASGKTNVQTNKKLTFTVKDDISTNTINSMTLMIWNRGYNWSKSINSGEVNFTFTDVVINNDEDFKFYITLPSSLSNITWNLEFSIIDNKIPWFNFRKIILKGDIFEVIERNTPNFLTINKNEKTTEIIYDGVIRFEDDLTVDKLELIYSDNNSDMYHDERIFHIFFNDIEVFNSEEMEIIEWYTNYHPKIDWFRINKWEPINLRIVEDLLITDELHGSSTSFNLTYDWQANNWFRYSMSVNAADIKFESNNQNTLAKDTKYTRNTCYNSGYRYNNCDKNNKIVIFSWNYSATDDITLKSFSINHLLWSKLDKLGFNFYLYINDNLVGTYDMDDINETQVLSNIPINSSGTSIKLLAEPTIYDEAYRFLWSITFGREKQNWTTWKDNATTEITKSVDSNVNVDYLDGFKDNVYIRMNQYTIGWFIPTPNNSTNSSVGIVKFKLSWTANIDINEVKLQNEEVPYDGEYYVYKWGCPYGGCQFRINSKTIGSVIFSDLIVNGIPRDNISYTTYFIDEGLAVLSFETQNHNDYNTTFKTAKSIWWNVTINNLKIYANWNDTPIYQDIWEVGSYVSVNSTSTDQVIDKISYDVITNSWTETIVIEKSVVPDFFKDKFGEERVVTKF